MELPEEYEMRALDTVIFVILVMDGPRPCVGENAKILCGCAQWPCELISNL
jgi:hypothetical protein